MQNITLITGNTDKIDHFRELLGMHIDYADLELTEIQSTSVSEVVKHKAEEAYQKLQTPVLVDDSGLTIMHWGRLPGALIKYFLGEVGNQGILNMLADNPREAYMETALGYRDQNGLQMFVGKVEGKISQEVRGDKGWGYDLIFIPENETRTCAEMDPNDYWKYSARKRALTQMKAQLKF